MMVAWIVAGYLVIGLALGAWIVWSNLARFFAAGFQWKRMIKHVAMVMLFWPLAALELLFSHPRQDHAARHSAAEQDRS